MRCRGVFVRVFGAWATKGRSVQDLYGDHARQTPRPVLSLTSAGNAPGSWMADEQGDVLGVDLPPSGTRPLRQPVPGEPIGPGGGIQGVDSGLPPGVESRAQGGPGMIDVSGNHQAESSNASSRNPDWMG